MSYPSDRKERWIWTVGQPAHTSMQGRSRRQGAVARSQVDAKKTNWMGVTYWKVSTDLQISKLAQNSKARPGRRLDNAQDLRPCRLTPDLTRSQMLRRATILLNVIW